MGGQDAKKTRHYLSGVTGGIRAVAEPILNFKLRNT